jgi:cytoskeletal protein CcmA (bactofilin family)
MLCTTTASAPGRPDDTVLGAGTRFKGEVDLGTGDLRAEGTVEGTIASQGTVTVLPAGLVRGTILARRLVVTGRVEGTFQVTGCLEIRGSGWVEGEVRTGTLVVDEGTTLQGRCGSLEAPPSAPPAQPLPGAAGSPVSKLPTPPRPVRPGTLPGPRIGRPVLAMVLAVMAGTALLLVARFTHFRHRQAEVLAPVQIEPAPAPVAAPPAPPRSEPAPTANRPRRKASPQKTRPQEVPTMPPGSAKVNEPEGSGP